MGTDEAGLTGIRERQRAFFRTGATLSYESRRNALRRLTGALRAHEAALCGALARDLGKCWHEAYETEIGMLLQESRHVLANLQVWMSPQRVSTPLSQFHSHAYTVARPRGSVLAITPWNYPIYLSISPVICALAAGNTIVIKPSERAPETARALCALFEDVFDAELAWCAPADRDLGASLAQLGWDHIHFVGSAETGRRVLDTAHRTLTPVTLELGGKNPCIVDDTAPPALSARRIAWGKFLNAGQTCIAPDYLAVHAAARDDLLSAIRAELGRMYGPDPAASPAYGRIVDNRHFEHLVDLLGSHAPVHGGQRDPSTRYFAPTVVELDSWDCRLAREEVFGPILPVLTWHDEQELRERLHAQPDALAAYVFSRRTPWARNMLGCIRCGGGCINDTISHVVPTGLPFGGVGRSGYGRTRARAGFEAMSNLVSVLEKATWFDAPVRYPPLTAAKKTMLRWFMR